MGEEDKKRPKPKRQRVRWVRVKKNQRTTILTLRRIRFCPHCGERVGVSRLWGANMAEKMLGFAEGLGTCEGCHQLIDVLPGFIKIPHSVVRTR